LKSSVPVYHGGSGGGQSNTFELGSDEYVTSIRVFAGRYINQIQIATNLQELPALPPNPQGSSGPFTWNTPAGTKFVGWGGHSGVFLDGLYPVYVAFTEAKWRDVVRGALPSVPVLLRERTAEDARLDADIEIVPVILQWAKNQKAIIRQLFLQKGGWEGWAQCEIARELQRAFPSNATTIVRENDEAYVAQALRCDISITMPGKTAAIIELKCESLFQDARANKAFCHALATDVTKIFTAALTNQYTPAKLYAIGFTCSTQIAGQVQNYNFGAQLSSQKVDDAAFDPITMWVVSTSFPAPAAGSSSALYEAAVTLSTPSAN
jgi:hypothetical protein